MDHPLINHMNAKPPLHRAVTVTILIALVTVATAHSLLARGGGPQWGYSAPAGGTGWGGISLRSIYGIPHHSLDAPNFTYGSGAATSFNSGEHAAGIDRSDFAGASSDALVSLPNFNQP